MDNSIRERVQSYLLTQDAPVRNDIQFKETQVSGTDQILSFLLLPTLLVDTIPECWEMVGLCVTGNIQGEELPLFVKRKKHITDRAYITNVGCIYPCTFFFVDSL